MNPHQQDPAQAPAGDTAEPLDRDQLAAVVAADIAPGSVANLGIGQPTRVANHLAAEQDVTLHTENGMLGMGHEAVDDEIDPDLVNAGKVPVTEAEGVSYFHHADSFAMMRGGHIDVCVLGAYQVSVGGDLANWHTGDPEAIPSVGGAMDLAVGAQRTWVMMKLFTKDGQAKLVEALSYPATGLGCVSRVYTEYAVFDIEPGRSGGDGAADDGGREPTVRVRSVHGVDREQLAAWLPATVECGER
ncbi:3-oxoacid CoA-transferase subunit B [Nesterenkonia halophila]|uniref:CoA-transferase n=1 Tax=Nesterenkonia halophila TaxID=302044 RepID=UPI0012929B48|nr:CoA-transferase [Nesterenkonia halophila]